MVSESQTETMYLAEETASKPLRAWGYIKTAAAPGGRQLIGRTVDQYRILSRLGKGGMGVIYRAEDLRLDRHVALKFAGRRKPGMGECIRREAQAGAAVAHANVCSVYDVGEFEGRPYLVMELLEGRPLRQMLQLPMTLDRFFDLGIQISAGLEAVHSAGIVHRDIKPSNIFVTWNEEAKIVDFGLALIETELCTVPSRDGPRKIRGTPAYMSPEQILGEPLDWRTDLFSLGAVFYEMLTGRRPFHGATTSGVLDAVLRGPIVPVSKLQPAVSAGVGMLIETTLEKDRELRCQSAADLRATLKRLQRDCAMAAA